MKKAISIVLITLMIFGILGCSNSEMPEGFKNKHLYSDLIYILTTAQNDLENGTLSHSLEPEDYKLDKFLNKLEGYNNKKLTETESEALSLGWQVLLNLDLYMTDYPNIKLTGYKNKTLENARDLIVIMKLDIEI